MNIGECKEEEGLVVLPPSYLHEYSNLSQEGTVNNTVHAGGVSPLPSATAGSVQLK